MYVAKLAIPMVGWGYPKDIGNKTINSDNYDILNISVIFRLLADHNM